MSRSPDRKRQRKAIAARDGARCFYCGCSFPDLVGATLDHYVPRRLWPGWRQSNLVLACDPCNSRKADALPWPFAWLLLRYAAADPALYAPAA
ncbi:HNH endonuclease [Streptomyces coffeae]|uniref:HNH endonuclease n=1 Tax=Streptomyces coffeae TaxID=621382 RepID=UPI0027DDC523|nr:HNH endonuclease signature motif containing protein [Streptomyces coffeae]